MYCDKFKNSDNKATSREDHSTVLGNIFKSYDVRGKIGAQLIIKSVE